MRVRVLNDPEIVRMLNKRACSIDYNLVKDGFPFHLPAFRSMGDAALFTPWYRLNFALQMLLSADGTRMFTAQYYEALRMIGAHGSDETFEPERLESALDRHDQWLAAKRGDFGDLSETESVLAAREERERTLFSEGRFWTAAFLGDRLNRWDFVSGLVEERAAPGVRNSVIHALGDMLANEEPLPPAAAKGLRAIYPEDFIDPVMQSVSIPADRGRVG